MAIRKKDSGNYVVLHEQDQSTPHSSISARDEDDEAVAIREQLDRMARESHEAVRRIKEMWRKLH